MEYIDLMKEQETLSENQRALLTALAVCPLQIDELIEQTGLDAQTALAELTMLQLEGLVEQEPGKRFTLKITRG